MRKEGEREGGRKGGREVGKKEERKTPFLSLMSNLLCSFFALALIYSLLSLTCKC